MSAYVVPKAHIATLAFYALGGSHRIGNRFGSMLELANKLAAENQASVNYRYNEAAPVDAFASENEVVKLARFDLLTKPVAILKAIQCLIYQSCEHPAWNESEAKLALAHMRSAAIGELPGYDDAEWSVDEKPAPARVAVVKAVLQ